MAPMSTVMTDVVKYPKGDLRRMLSVLAAIDDAEPEATLVKVAARTGLDKKTVTSLIAQARVQAGVTVIKRGPYYTLEDWGPIFQRSGAQMVLTGAFNAPTIIP